MHCDLANCGHYGRRRGPRAGKGAPVVLLLIAASLYSSSAVAQEGKDPQVVFNTHCRQCHTTEKDDNRLGPSLYGIFGKKAGTTTNFAYSDSLKSSGVTWDEATLDKWITNPDSVIPNNGMRPYPGITDANIRRTIVSFLKNQKN